MLQFVYASHLGNSYKMRGQFDKHNNVITKRRLVDRAESRAPALLRHSRKIHRVLVVISVERFVSLVVDHGYSADNGPRRVANVNTTSYLIFPSSRVPFRSLHRTRMSFRGARGVFKKFSHFPLVNSRSTSPRVKFGSGDGGRDGC